MGYLGLEPRTYRLKAEYSTIELATLFLIVLLNIIFKAFLFVCLRFFLPKEEIKKTKGTKNVDRSYSSIYYFS